MYSGGVLSLALSGGASQGDTSLTETDPALINLIFQLIYIVTFVLLVLRWRKVIVFLKKDKFICVSIGLASASFLWSVDPTISLVRGIALIGTSLFGLYLATRYTLEEQLQLFRLTFFLVVISSFVSALLLPKYGIMSGVHAGAWRGIFVHKNVLGKIMALSASVFLVQVNELQHRTLNCIGLSLSFILLLFSKSSSSMISFIVLFAIFLILRTLRWRYEFIVPVFLAFLIIGTNIYVALTEHADTLLIFMGKDPTLTGRTDLWFWILENIWRRPWLGYGYGAFWEETNSKAVLIRYAAAWNVPNAHNGLLDIWADLGIFGVTLLLLSVLTTIIKAFALLRKTKISTYIWPLLFVSNTILANLTETTLMVRNDLFWVIYVTVAFSVLVPLKQEADISPLRTALS